MTHISENAQDAKRHMDEVLGRIRPRLAGFTEEQRLIVGESLMCELANANPRLRDGLIELGYIEESEA